MALHPEYPSYATQSKRLHSFKTWPPDLFQKPGEMASAGFFYTGKSDKVICYFCGGKFKDWNQEDLPWSVHARWFQFCPYVLLIKGKEYVQSVINETYENHDQSVNNNIACLKNDVNKAIHYCTGMKEAVTLLCKICLEEEIRVCYRPCGHAVTCAKCALSLKNMLCPICRTEIDNVFRIYFA